MTGNGAWAVHPDIEGNPFDLARVTPAMSAVWQTFPALMAGHRAYLRGMEGRDDEMPMANAGPQPG